MARFPSIGFILSVLSLFVACGCADDLRGKNLFDAGAGDAVLRFSVENISLTRAEDGRDTESLIDHAYLLFYSKDASVLTANPLAAVKATVEDSNPSALTFKMPLSLQADTDYQLVAIANADGFVSDGFSTFAEYLQSWSSSSVEGRGMLSFYSSGRIHASADSPLPMRGVLNGESYFRFSMQNGEYNVSSSVSFRRAVARIDVANIVKEGFKIEGVALCNWRDAALAVSEEGELGNRLGSVRGVLSDEDSPTVEFETMPDSDDDGIQRLQKAIYCFPSVSYDSYSADKESIALIIKAKYGQDAESTYYRVNVGASGNKAEVKSNTKYLVTIQSVKGSGALTAQEAYAAEESPIVLSVVEDWDLDVNNYAMDDNGNFLIVSSGKMEFTGDAVENRELKVLTSRGTKWTNQFLADNDESADAFSVSNLNDSYITVGPTGKNTGENVLSGKLIVSAQTPEGNVLTVNVVLTQNPVAEQPDDPTVIPEDMPFALIPVSTDRVKISHENRTIEIDGFDPNCFNSFIDIPFKVYIKDSSLSSINISTTLQWPLEGRVSLDRSSKYFYCLQSFASFGSGQVSDESGKVYSYGELFNSSTIVRKDVDVVYLSIGAMGPDDPAIVRDIVLHNNGKEIVYEVTLKPHKAIIGDVVLNDSVNAWLIMDRNIQTDGTKYTGWDEFGSRHQAYNYCEQSIIVIPFKFLEKNVSFSEMQHESYRGDRVTYAQRNNMTKRRKDWLQKYINSNLSESDFSFYKSENIETWVYPNSDVMHLCGKKMKISKMRMFLVSDMPAFDGNDDIPICCYWPFIGSGLNDNSYPRNGYFFIKDGGVTLYSYGSIMFLFIEVNKVNTYELAVKNDDYGLSRLVRPLTNEELEMYKNNYLGYGSEPHKLTICHPDTYESTSLGWLPY